jgi:hypothetical protein
VGVVSCVHTLATPEPDLSGSIACGVMTCNSGELCIDKEVDGPGGSNDPIEEYSCATPPPSCPLVACNGTCGINGGPSSCCPSCIANLCGPIVSYDGERSVGCYGF